MTTRRSISISLSVDSVEQLKRIGAEFFEEPPKELTLPFTDANCLVRHESEVLSRLRKRLAERFERPVDHRFFSESYQPGETPNEALLRMFKRLQWMVSLTDEQTIESLAKRR